MATHIPVGRAAALTAILVLFSLHIYRLGQPIDLKEGRGKKNRKILGDSRRNTGFKRLRGGAKGYRDEDTSRDDQGDSWIYRHTSARPFMCEVNPAWIRDQFNLNGLQNEVPHYDLCVRHILDYNVGFDRLPAKRASELEACCETLYGLVHARYVLSPEGLERMRLKYERGDFGACPRALCKGARLLPCGITDQPRLRPVKSYCPSCRELYHVRVRHAATLDGSFFGTTFPHMFLLKFPHYQARSQPVEFQPRIFGFDVQYPQLPTAEQFANEEAERMAQEMAERERAEREEREKKSLAAEENATQDREKAHETVEHVHTRTDSSAAMRDVDVQVHADINARVKGAVHA
ncbi:hypothetical protein AAMO2058_001367600 [Amorphochlora amoebiformis]